MESRSRSTRRDTRFGLRSGSASVEFADSRAEKVRMTGSVVGVCVAGVTLCVPGEASRFPLGTRLENMAVRVGQCLVGGKAVVRNVYELELGKIEVGCLFYPFPADEDRWMALIAGIESVSPADSDRA